MGYSGEFVVGYLGEVVVDYSEELVEYLVVAAVALLHHRLQLPNKSQTLTTTIERYRFLVLLALYILHNIPRHLEFLVCNFRISWWRSYWH